jgi:outer membrane protein OmpA-like peptidoglycan-associated protein
MRNAPIHPSDRAQAGRQREDASPALATRGRGTTAERLALAALALMLGACAALPTIPDPSRLQAPTKTILLTEGVIDTPHEVLGAVEATLGGLRNSDLPSAVDAAKQHLRNAAYTKYGERLDAIMHVKTSPVSTGGPFAGQFAGTRGVRGEGVAIAIKSLPTTPDPASLKAPTKTIIIAAGSLNTPHEVLGPIEATLGGLRASDLPGAADAAKQHLRNAAYTKYGERLDAIMNVRTSTASTGGAVAEQFAGTQGVRAEGVAIAISLLPPDSTQELGFPEAIAVATDAMIRQLQKLPSFLGSADKHALVIDPMLDATSGQQTAATRQMEQLVADRLRTYEQLELLPFQIPMFSKAEYLLTGTMRRLGTQPPGSRGMFQLNLALTDTKTGMIIARASSRARDDALDTEPTPYYRDSPILVKDEVVDGYIATAETPSGRPADAVYFSRVTTATLISEALVAYNSDRYQDALALYRTAATTPAGEQLRVVNGIYLATWKLGQTSEAEEAFRHIVALALRTNNLGVKFLFNRDSTDFWPDPKVSGPYAIWLRQIARQVAAAKVCLNVVGHASRTGSEAHNDRLSLQRALFIKDRLAAQAPELATRLMATGMGFRENLVGTGTDDARDALDRRVEFKLTGC